MPQPPERSAHEFDFWDPSVEQPQLSADSTEVLRTIRFPLRLLNWATHELAMDVQDTPLNNIESGQMQRLISELSWFSAVEGKLFDAEAHESKHTHSGSPFGDMYTRAHCHFPNVNSTDAPLPLPTPPAPPPYPLAAEIADPFFPEPTSRPTWDPTFTPETSHANAHASDFPVTNVAKPPSAIDETTPVGAAEPTRALDASPVAERLTGNSSARLTGNSADRLPSDERNLSEMESLFGVPRGNQEIIEPIKQPISTKRTASHEMKTLGSSGQLRPPDGRFARFRWNIGKLIKYKCFEYSMAVAILLNAIILGIQADVQTKSALDGTHVLDATASFFRYIGVVFTIIFSIELFLRLMSEGTFFISPNNRVLYWNLFDALVVITSVFDDFLSVFVVGNTDSAKPTTTLRLVKLTRLVRLVRVFRVFRFFRDLRVIVNGIMGSAKSLFWAILLLFIIMYIFAVGILQLISDKWADNPHLRIFYSGMLQSMYTLYKSIVGGIDWGDAAQPLFDTDPFLGLFYSLYISFAVLCVLNIVTGVFVENAAKMVAKDEEHMIMEELSTRKQWMDDVRYIFASADDDGDGGVDWDEFCTHINDTRIQAYFHKIGLDVESQCTEGLFQLLDFDGDGIVDLDEFASSMQQIHGPARNIDIVRLKHDSRKMLSWMRDFGDALDIFLNLDSDCKLGSQRITKRSTKMKKSKSRKGRFSAS